MSCFFTCFTKKEVYLPKKAMDISEDISSIVNCKLYSYNELEAATGRFSSSNKIGEGGFGAVYKGKLRDGTMAALKVLSVHSSQGVREFLTEINLITHIEHENLVKLLGCCIEGSHRILVYGYLENNSLAHTLLGHGHSSVQFNWKTRSNICISVAKGLAFLHEEVQPHIIHRDIKASNILLDKDLTAKISDFGLAKLFPANMTHLSTRVAGTEGYLAPEYAIRGQLTRRADIYSYGVLLLEIISGRSNTMRMLPAEERYLLHRAWELHKRGELIELLDISMPGDFDADEVSRYLKIGLLCTQGIPKLRPTMSVVVKMLTGEIDVISEDISSPGLFSELMVLKKDKFDTTTESSNSDGLRNSSSEITSTSYATMTFTSIYDRSN